MTFGGPYCAACPHPADCAAHGCAGIDPLLAIIEEAEAEVEVEEQLRAAARAAASVYPEPVYAVACPWCRAAPRRPCVGLVGNVHKSRRKRATLAIGPSA